jgi:hypothetical protein
MRMSFVFNGPDEQLAVRDWAAGAQGPGIGGNLCRHAGALSGPIYGCFEKGRPRKKAAGSRNEACRIIYENVLGGTATSTRSMKEVLRRRRGGPDVGDVRLPMPQLTEKGV